MDDKNNKVYTKTKIETRSITGNFLPFREVGHYKGVQRRKHRVCACCHHAIDAHKNANSFYCSSCSLYIKHMRLRYNTLMKRLRQENIQWRELGNIGRIKQQLKSGLDAHLKVKRLVNKYKYYKNKYEVLKDDNE